MDRLLQFWDHPTQGQRMRGETNPKPWQRTTDRSPRYSVFLRSRSAPIAASAMTEKQERKWRESLARSERRAARGRL